MPGKIVILKIVFSMIGFCVIMEAIWWILKGITKLKQFFRSEKISMPEKGEKMAKCVNENCSKNPLDSMDKVLVNADGDFACCHACADTYRAQMDHFLTHILPDPQKTEDWLRGQ